MKTCRYIFRLLLLALCAGLARDGRADETRAIEWGIGGPSILRTEQQLQKAFGILRQRGLKTYRLDVNLSRPEEAGARFRLVTELAERNGIVLKPILMLPLHWKDDPLKPLRADLDPQGAYREAYAVTYDFVSRFAQSARDWEMSNEINLRARYDNGGEDLRPPESWQKSTFDTPRMHVWAAAIRAQGDAIDAVGRERGLPLRKVFNTTGNYFGFVDFMIENGVRFDVLSYHYYARLGVVMSNYWNGPLPQINLFRVLAGYGKPIIFNEINCAEIYREDYVNQDGGRLAIRCLKSLDNIIREISSQTIADVEGVQVYTLVDMPHIVGKPAESRFGVMYDLDRPKLSLALVSLHAGGLVTPDERTKLKLLGIEK